jgi:hypothetical protein
VPEGTEVRVGQRLAEVRGCDGTPAQVVPALAAGTLWHQVREGEVLTAGSVIGLIE